MAIIRCAWLWRTSASHISASWRSEDWWWMCPMMRRCSLGHIVRGSGPWRKSGGSFSLRQWGTDPPEGVPDGNHRVMVRLAKPEWKTFSWNERLRLVRVIGRGGHGWQKPRFRWPPRYIEPLEDEPRRAWVKTRREDFKESDSIMIE